MNIVFESFLDENLAIQFKDHLMAKGVSSFIEPSKSPKRFSKSTVQVDRPKKYYVKIDENDFVDAQFAAESFTRS